MDGGLLDEIEHYIQSPNIIVDQVRQIPEQGYEADFRRSMKVSKIRYPSFSTGIRNDVRTVDLPQLHVKDQIKYCLSISPEGSKVHVQLFELRALVKYLYPKVRHISSFDYPWSGKVRNRIELIFPDGTEVDSREKAFGKISLTVKKFPRYQIGLSGGRGTQTRAIFGFDGEFTDADLNLTLSYLKLLGAHVEQESFVVAVDYNYNRKNIAFIRILERIMKKVEKPR